MRRAKVGDVVHVKGKRGRWIVTRLVECRRSADLWPITGYEIKQEWPKGHVLLAERQRFRVLRGRNAANFKNTPKELVAALSPPRRRR